MGLVTLGSGLTSLSFVNSGVIAGTTYHYRVRAENSSGDSGYASTSVFVPPPTGDPYTDTDYLFRLSASSPGTPSDGETLLNHTPTDWSRTEPAPTATEGVWRVRRTRMFSGAMVFLSATAWTGLAEIHPPTGDESYTDTDYAYQVSAGSPGTPSDGTSTENHTPTGWTRSELTANDATATEGVWRVERTRSFDGPNMFDSATAWTGLAEIHPPTGAPPGAPVGFNVSAGASSFSGSWNAPTSFEGSLSYEYGYRLSGGSWVTGTTSSTSFSVSHTSFTEGASYEFRVRSVDDNGESGYVTDTATVPLTVPGAVRGLSVEVSDSDAEVTWLAPDSGGPVASYDAQLSGFATVTTTQLSASFNSVEDGSHTFPSHCVE